MPQLDLGIYFFQIFSNFFFFWFLYFYIKFFILGKLSNIIKIKNFYYLNNNYTYSLNSIFFNQFELNYYNSNIWNNFHNFNLFFNTIKIKNEKLYNLFYLKNIYLFLNFFFINLSLSRSNNKLNILQLVLLN